MKKIISTLAVCALTAIPAIASEIDLQTSSYSEKGTGRALTPEDLDKSVSAKRESSQISQLLSVIAATPSQGAEFAVTLSGPMKSAKVEVAASGAAKSIRLSDSTSAVVKSWTISAATTDSERTEMIVAIAKTLGIPDSEISATAPGTEQRSQKK